jgi:hypothetical protein
MDEYQLLNFYGENEVLIVLDSEQRQRVADGKLFLTIVVHEGTLTLSLRNTCEPRKDGVASWNLPFPTQWYK